MAFVYLRPPRRLLPTVTPVRAALGAMAVTVRTLTSVIAWGPVAIL